MSIKSDLKKEGIVVTSQIDTLIVNSIARSISRRMVETFPDLHFTESSLFRKLAKLNMYKAQMPQGVAEANYFYKNTSIYFNECIDEQDLEEFAIHECIHYLQEVKDDNNKLIKMGLSTYSGHKPEGISLNESAVQYTSSYIIGIEPGFEKYYEITLYTPSPSYYPLECSLLNEILYFTGNDVLFKSTLFSTDEFKNKIIELTSVKTFNQIQNLFDELLNLEEKITKLNSKIDSMQDGSSAVDKLINKENKYKQKISETYFNIQNLIIKDFFNAEFNKVSNLEELDNFRRKLYKFTDIIGNTKDYTFFNNYYVEMMNKLEHKCNILENGGIETAISNQTSNPFVTLFYKLLDLRKSHKTAQ